MKKTLFTFSLLLSCVLAFSQTQSYPGNGKSGFGGAIGLGTITITERSDTIIFRLNRGTGLFDSLVVFYIDEPTTTTGVSTTANITYTGTNDKYSVAASGRFSATQQAVLNFPANFKPDMAVVFDKDGGKIYFLYEMFGLPFLQEQGTFPVMPAGSNSASVYSAITFKTQFGLAPTDTMNFNFMGSYIGQNASRSNEAVGDPFTNYQRVDGYNPYTVQSFLNFSSAQALPVSLVDFNAVKEQSMIKLKWTVAQETNIDNYEIQRSVNGSDFSTIATVNANNASHTTSYAGYDKTPLKGNNYYRLKVNERGRNQISKVILMKNDVIKSKFAVAQIGNTLNIQLQDVAAGMQKIMIINTNGQLVQTSSLLHDGMDGMKQIDINNIRAKGIYRIVVQSATESLVQSIMLQ